MRWFIGAPELHHWHHDLDRRAGNYANISPLMDLLFGTYKCPDHEPEQFGVHQPIAQNWLRQMIDPFFAQPAKRVNTENTESTEETAERTENEQLGLTDAGRHEVQYS